MSNIGTVGHNSKIHSFANRIDTLENDKAALSKDIRDTYAEAKQAGLNVPALKQAVKRYRMDQEKRQKQDELEETVETYLLALGMLSDTPLGQAAVEREFG